MSKGFLDATDIAIDGANGIDWLVFEMRRGVPTVMVSRVPRKTIQFIKYDIKAGVLTGNSS